MKSKSKKNPKWLNLACGNWPIEGFTGVDFIMKGTKADIEVDLLKFPWPFKDNSIERVYCSHFVEHIPHGDGYHDPFFDFFNELNRICKKGAEIIIRVPYYTSMRAFQDPSHNRFIPEMTFMYFDREWRKINKLLYYPINCDFKTVKIDHATGENKMTGKGPEAIQHAVMSYWNTVDDMIVTMKKQ
jgi:predicted SAM-dependent methyltransferase